MRKITEANNPMSCFSRAESDEMIFVLLGRDAASPATIRSWVKERIRLGKNSEEDEQIKEALLAAKIMENERPTIRRLIEMRGGQIGLLRR